MGPIHIRQAHHQEALMRTPRRAAFFVIAALLALGSWFGSLGVLAQEQAATTVAQPGGDLPGDPSVQLVQVAGGLIDPINVQSANDGTGRLFVVERVGYIRIIENGELIEEPFLDLTDEVKTDFLEQGLLGLAFHPDYENNGRFYVFYADYTTNGDHFVVEYTVSPDDPNVADPESGRVILSVDDPFFNHNGGTMHFGPDGYLYITIGDGGMAGDPYDNAQDLSTLLGKILRLDVDAEGEEAYGIPEDNPFAGAGIGQSSVENEPAQTGDYRPDARPEIYAYGLRNAWQFTFDMETGDMYIADVGQIAWEEINFKAADEPGGQNYGWDLMEGAHCYPPDEGEACGSWGVLPVAEFDHGQTGGCSITGGGVYRGEMSADLDGIYFASDFCSGRVWGLQQDDAGAWQFEELLDTELNVTGAGTGEDGEVYFTSCNCQFGKDYNPMADPQGAVWQVVSSDQVPEGAETAPLAEAPAGQASPEVTGEDMGTPEATPAGG
jgi:glucose/arabinose dehydrogenase